jgi:hypothetical protein
MDVAIAIFLVIVGHFTTVAIRAGREIKILQPFSQGQVFGTIPDVK